VCMPWSFYLIICSVRAMHRPVLSTDKSTAEFIENGIPTLLVRFCHVTLRKAGMHKSHESAFSLSLECHRNHCFLSQGIP